jgi:hypothetical protein
MPKLRLVFIIELLLGVEGVETAACGTGGV